MEGTTQEPMTTEDTSVETPMEGAQCEPNQQASTEYNEASFAVLLALVPLLVFTLFGQVGLF